MENWNDFSKHLLSVTLAADSKCFFDTHISNQGDATPATTTNDKKEGKVWKNYNLVKHLISNNKAKQMEDTKWTTLHLLQIPRLSLQHWKEFFIILENYIPTPTPLFHTFLKKKNLQRKLRPAATIVVASPFYHLHHFRQGWLHFHVCIQSLSAHSL